MLRRSLWIGVMAGVVVAIHTSAAVLYDFRQTSRSATQDGTPMLVEGRGVIDGDRSRVDFTGGNGYRIGSYIITKDGADDVLMVDPRSKSYAAVDLSSLASRIASGQIEITNLKTKVELLKDHPMVAGLPTDHYRIETSYQITWRGGPLPLTQSVSTVVEKWTTTAFGDVAGSFVDDSVFRTGNREFDELLSTELRKVKGLPLRQVTRVTTSGSGNLSKPSTTLGVTPSRIQTNEMLLSNVRVETVPASYFEVPVGFSAVDAGAVRRDEQKVHVLSMESNDTPN